MSELASLHAAEPAAQVTLNMLNHADALGYDLDGEQYAAIYRAMAAVAPEELYHPGERRIDALVAANQQWHATWSEPEMQRQAAVARVAELEAENAQWRKNDVEGDNLIGELQKRIATLCSERDALRRALDIVIAGQKAAATPFVAADLDPPARRPDGTLAPAGKPLPVMKARGDTRRVGG